ncbi:MAG: helix-turn-helix transcriptional regulator [Spirochaetaceae bacterium]|jgi:transcriptional regulator with XRE-family HTH domain|nr:helix-turn-helix transcriptional regulator [Spirochaetaceae bacterium]
MTDIKDVFASNLKKIRHAKGLNQAELAGKAEVSKNYIGFLETARKFPSSEMVQKLAQALDIDPTELFAKEIDVQKVILATQKAVYKEIGTLIDRTVSEIINTKVAELEELEPVA